MGRLACPSCEVLPLLDDEQCCHRFAPYTGPPRCKVARLRRRSEMSLFKDSLQKMIKEREFPSQGYLQASTAGELSVAIKDEN